MDEEVVKAAFRRVLKECPSSGLGEYAKSYARIGLSMTVDLGLRTQALYVLTNLRYWRGDAAREVKAVLKAEIGAR